MSLVCHVAELDVVDLVLGILVCVEGPGECSQGVFCQLFHRTEVVPQFSYSSFSGKVMAPDGLEFSSFHA